MQWEKQEKTKFSSYLVCVAHTFAIVFVIHYFRPLHMEECTHRKTNVFISVDGTDATCYFLWT